ncbi:sigma-54-dependent transcriptional regulator [Candidatus Margulisiibacteriota bacterium]
MTKPKVLIIDDETAIRKTLHYILHKDYTIIEADSGKAGLEKLRKHQVFIVLLDVMMPGMDGLETLKRIKEMDPCIEICMLTGVENTVTAVQATKLGAFDYLVKPVEIEKIKITIQHMLSAVNTIKENISLKASLNEFVPDGLITKCAKMQNILSSMKNISNSNSNVLITGETGTGKEILARILHKYSSRGDKPFLAINCCAIPDTLLESEMFGFEKGSFTGAVERKLGKLELADGGTLFLDEIGNMSPFLQAKLLRVIQEKEFTRIGSNKIISIDVRIISATHINIKKAIKDETFRDDLYYRLNVVPIHLPPLRERGEDIKELFDYFQEKFSKVFRHNSLSLSPETLRIMENYSWPGNIRELENLVERLLALGKTGVIRRDDLPLDFLMEVDAFKDSYKTASNTDGSFKTALQRFEKDLITRALHVSKNNRSKAAELLGMHRNTLMQKIKELSITP